MRRPGIRKLVIAAVVAAGPAVALVAEAVPSAPAPQAENFICASVGQVHLGLCVGPPIAAATHQLG